MTTLPKRITDAWIDRTEDNKLLEAAYASLTNRQDEMLSKTRDEDELMMSDRWDKLTDKIIQIENKL